MISCCCLPVSFQGVGQTYCCGGFSPTEPFVHFVFGCGSSQIEHTWRYLHPWPNLQSPPYLLYLMQVGGWPARAVADEREVDGYGCMRRYLPLAEPKGHSLESWSSDMHHSHQEVGRAQPVRHLEYMLGSTLDQSFRPVSAMC